MVNNFNLSIYKGKKVLVTGHTGFKGSWMCRILADAGAELVGYSRCSEKEKSLYRQLGLDSDMRGIKGDIRDFERMQRVFHEVEPEIVFHLAAQPIVRIGYSAPRETFETNVMGTVNVLECVRACDSVKSLLNVTTDKVYTNKEWPWPYRENDRLDGADPYSNSKSCSELVTHSYKSSFFTDGHCAVSTARAGNVIGGGDYAKDRIIPDCIRAVSKGEAIGVRNPKSVRPYQHVLEPVTAYLMIAARQTEEPELSGSYNIGPENSDFITTGELADIFCRAWGDSARWEKRGEPDAPREASFLRLDSSLIKNIFGWSAVWGAEKAVGKTVEWAKAELRGENMNDITRKQISDYLED